MKISSIFTPTYVPFGADVKKICFFNNLIVKTFRNTITYNNTLNFYNLYVIENEDKLLFPKLIETRDYANEIVFNNCGNLLNLYNLPDDWENQLNKLLHFFLKKEMLVLDIRFMPHTPYTINNLCIKDNRIYLVDVGLYKKKNNIFINNYFSTLIYKIYLFNKWKNNPCILFILHFTYLFIWVITDLIERAFDK